MGKRLPPQERFGKRLRKVRREQEMSQMDLVRDHGFTLSHYQKMERGQLDPRMTTILRLAEALGVEPGELLDDL